MSLDSYHDVTAKIHRHHTPFDFTIIPNSTARDHRLSWAAKGMLVHLLSFPSDCDVYVAELAEFYTGTQKGNGRDAVRSIFNELKKYRYLFHTVTKSPDGTWKHRYDVHNQPQPETDHPAPVNPCVIEERLPLRKKKIIIAQDSPTEEKTPAAGNNNFHAKKKEEKKIYPCLEELDIFAHTKKSLTAKHTEEQVQYATQLLTHKDSIYHGKGTKESSLLLQHALNDPCRYKDTIDNLGQPKLTKQQREAKEREIATSEDEQRIEQNHKWVKQSGFINFASYNGWRCKITNDSIGFSAKHSGWSIHYRQKDFIQALKEHLKSFGIDIPNI